MFEGLKHKMQDKLIDWAEEAAERRERKKREEKAEKIRQEFLNVLTLHYAAKRLERRARNEARALREERDAIADGLGEWIDEDEEFALEQMQKVLDEYNVPVDVEDIVTVEREGEPDDAPETEDDPHCSECGRADRDVSYTYGPDNNLCWRCNEKRLASSDGTLECTLGCDKEFSSVGGRRSHESQIHNKIYIDNEDVYVPGIDDRVEEVKWVAQKVGEPVSVKDVVEALHDASPVQSEPLYTVYSDAMRRSDDLEVVGEVSGTMGGNENLYWFEGDVESEEEVDTDTELESDCTICGDSFDDAASRRRHEISMHDRFYIDEHDLYLPGVEAREELVRQVLSDADEPLPVRDIAEQASGEEPREQSDPLYRAFQNTIHPHMEEDVRIIGVTDDGANLYELDSDGKDPKFVKTNDGSYCNVCGGRQTINNQNGEKIKCPACHYKCNKCGKAYVQQKSYEKHVRDCDE